MMEGEWMGRWVDGWLGDRWMVGGWMDGWMVDGWISQMREALSALP